MHYARSAYDDPNTSIDGMQKGTKRRPGYRAIKSQGPDTLPSYTGHMQRLN